MSSKNLSTVATDVIETYGITATNVINAYRFGGERFIGFVDTRIASAVSGVPSALGTGLRSKLMDGQKRVSSYSVKGLHLALTGRSASLAWPSIWPPKASACWPPTQCVSSAPPTSTP